MPRKKDKKDKRGGGLAPKTKLQIRKDKRAQAVLRAAKRPAFTETRTGPYSTVKLSGVPNPAVGIDSAMRSTTVKGADWTNHGLSFERYQPGNNDSSKDPYSTKAQRKPSSKQTPHSQHKDKLRSAAVKYAMGRFMDEMKAGDTVEAETAITSDKGRNPRGRVYEQQTKGALDFNRGQKTSTQSTKVSSDTWRPNSSQFRGQSNPTVKFDPNTLKQSLTTLAQNAVVSATSRLIGGPAQALVTVDDLTAAATGIRPSQEITKQHKQAQNKLIKAFQKLQIKQAPWVGSGPF